MPEDNLPKSTLPAAVRITTPSYRGNPRYAVGEERLFLKAPREDNGRILIEEWLNELVCNRLAKRLGLAVADMSLKKLADGRVMLASSIHSEVSLQQIPPENRSQIANIDDLVGLLVFDQLVFNSDRREDHVMLTGDPRATNGARWYAIDHGHTLHGPDGGGVTLEMVDSLSKAPIVPNFDYRVSSFSALRPWMERARHLSDDELDSLVDEIKREIIDCGIPIDVRARLEFRAEVVKAILRKRRAAIAEILSSWWSAIGRPPETAVPAAGQSVAAAVAPP